MEKIKSRKGWVGVTTEEISCYELAYQIRRYMDICHIDESQFAETISIPCEELTHFLAYHKSSFSISQISKICDTLYISMDSLVRGPVEEENFAVLLKRCAFVGKLKCTALYNVCMFFLKRWRERRISDSCLERYIKWFTYFCSKQEAPARSTGNNFRPISSAICFTRKISAKKAEKLKQLIEDSKKK